MELLSLEDELFITQTPHVEKEIDQIGQLADRELMEVIHFGKWFYIAICVITDPVYLDIYDDEDVFEEAKYGDKEIYVIVEGCCVDIWNELLQEKCFIFGYYFSFVITICVITEPVYLDIYDNEDVYEEAKYGDKDSFIFGYYWSFVTALCQQWHMSQIVA